MNTKFTLSLALTLAIAIFSPAFAQTKLASLFDSNTAAYARIDLQNIDVDATSTMLNEMLGADSRAAQAIQQFEPMFKSTVQSLKDTGSPEAYIVMSLTDMISPSPCFYIVAGDETAKQKAKAAIDGMVTGQFVQLACDDGILIGMADSIKRIQTGRLPLRTDLDEVFASHAESDLAVVIALSNEHRQVLGQAVANFPTPFEQFTGAMLASGASTVALRISPRADRVLELRVSGDDATENQQVAETFKTFLNSIASGETELPLFTEAAWFGGVVDESTAQKLNLDRVAALMNLEQSDNRFTISFNKSDGSYEQLCQSMTETSTAIGAAVSQVDRSNWLRQCVLACHNYHDHKGSLPPVAITDDASNSLLSWRVTILPYIEQNALYEQFHLDEPWDSEHNKTLIDQMPAIYITEADLAGEGKTTFVMPTGDGTVGGRTEPYTLMDIKDGTSRTILLLEVAPEAAVVWTKPDEWNFDPSDPLRGLFRENQTQIRAGFADGSIHLMTKDAKRVKAAITIDAGDLILDD